MSSNPESKLRAKSRIPMADDGPMSDAQREVYEKIIGGRRGKLVGPLRAALHSAELADRWQALGELLRFNTALDAQISELAIIVTGRYWNCQLEWFIHSEVAAEAGVGADVIESIRNAQPPSFDDPVQRGVYEFTRELLQFGRVSDAVYQDLIELIGAVPQVELAAVIGYYSMVAMTLNAHQVPLPESGSGTLLDLPKVESMMEPTRLPSTLS